MIEPMETGGESVNPPSGRTLVPAGDPTCATCGHVTTDNPEVAVPLAYVFALGQIEPRFPTLGIEKEFAQATGQSPTAGLSDREALQAVLAERQNRYLVRQLCWVMTIEGLETYILHPRDPLELDLLVNAVRASPRGTDVDVVIGVRGPIAPPSLCNGLALPIVIFDQIYSFDVDTFIDSVPRPKNISSDRFRPTAEELFQRIMQLTDNAGATDEHRAVNYLAVRYPSIYAQTAEAHAANASLTSVEVRPSRLSGVRNIVDVVFSYSDRQTTVTERYFVRVDVTEEFPFLVTRLSPFYER
jgi:hypothetical protein